ncbi:unnamed protein product, partial [Allacma fusca]
RDRDRSRDRNRVSFGDPNFSGNVFPGFGSTTTRRTESDFGGRFAPIPNPGIGGDSFRNNPDGSRNTLLREPRYFVVASRMVRPGQVYRVAVTIFPSPTQMAEIEVRASLLRNGVDIGSDTRLCQPNSPETLMIRVPRTSVVGHYRLRVEGNDNGLVGGTAFVNETDLNFSQRSMTIFIQTDKPV